MILKRITSILLTATILSQSILPAFAMESERIISKKQGKSFFEKENIPQNELLHQSRKRSEKTDPLMQKPLKKPHIDLTPEVKQERELVTKSLRSYLSQPKVAGVVIQPLDWVLFNEDASVASELLKDDPSCTITPIPLELIEDEAQRSDKMDSVETPVVSATRHKLSKRVVGKKGKTASGIFHYALFEGEILIPFGNRKDNEGWCHSGGESEDGETLEETSSRESKEELNGAYVPHPDLLSHQPFIDTITEKNNTPFFYRLFFQKVKYLPSDVFKKNLSNPHLEEHNREFTDIKWVKASDLWEAVASGNNILQVEGEDIQLYGPMFQTLSTKSGQSMLCKLWLDKTLNTTPSDIYFSVRDSFNQCYQIGNKWSTEEFAEIQKEFYLPKSTTPPENNKTLAIAVAAHGMAMVQHKRKFQEIESPTAPKTDLWNPKCEKTLSQIHLAMVLGDQYKEAEDFIGDPNPRRAANIENIKTYFSENNDAECWQKNSKDRKVTLIESDYGVLADILDWEETNKEWPTFYQGASHKVNALLKAFTYLRELIGVRSLKQLVAARGTDIYFKKDKKIWDMIDRTGAVENKETQNAMMFLNFVLFAMINTTDTTSSSVEYFINNHSVTEQDSSARFEEAMALCGFSKPDYSYFHSLFEQFIQYQHPTFENSVMLAISQNPESLDDYNYPTRCGGFVYSQGQINKSTAQFVHAIQNEFQQLRQQEQKPQWEFETPLDDESSEKVSHSKPQAQSSRVRFDSFHYDRERKKSLIPEDRYYLESGGSLNLGLVRSCAFDRFPLSAGEEQAYDTEMRKTTVHIIADWLAEHKQGIPGSFAEEPVIKKIYAMAYEKIMGEVLVETMSADGFMYLVQNSNQETVEGFISTYLNSFESKNEEVPLFMASNFLAAAVKYGNIDLFNNLLSRFPNVDLNGNFPNINYDKYSPEEVHLFNMLDMNTPNFSDIVKALLEKGVKTISKTRFYSRVEDKLLNELIPYRGQLKDGLRDWLDSICDSKKKGGIIDLKNLIRNGYHNLISSILSEAEELYIGSFPLDDLSPLLTQLKANKTLRNLTLHKDALRTFIAFLITEKGDMGLKTPWSDAPWFQKTWGEIQNIWEEMLTNPNEYIGHFINSKNYSMILSILKNTKAITIDLGYLFYGLENKEELDLLTEALKSNKNFKVLKIHDLGHNNMLQANALIEVLKDNGTLEELILPDNTKLRIMSILMNQEGAYRQAPWFTEAMRTITDDPVEALVTTSCFKYYDAFFSILASTPNETNLSNYMHYGSEEWVSFLTEVLAADKPFESGCLNLSNIPLSDEHVGALATALGKNKIIKSLNLTRCLPGSSGAKILSDGLKNNITLEKLILSRKDMVNVMSALTLSEQDTFTNAPWFKEAQLASFTTLESIQDVLMERDWPYFTDLIKNSTTEHLDLTNITFPSCDSPQVWLSPLIAGLRDNPRLHTLTLPNTWLMQEIMVVLISSPQGPFTRAPWFCDAWKEVIKNPDNYLWLAAHEQNDRAFLSILKALPEETELRNAMFRLGSWFDTLTQELAQDEPYLWLNLSGPSISVNQMSMLADALKTNTKLKSLNLTCAHPDDKQEELLAEGLKNNTTLEKLTVSNKQMFPVLEILMENQEAPFRQAPWFALTWKGMLESPEESIKAAYENATVNQKATGNLIQKIAHETQVESLDLTKIASHPNDWRLKFWIQPTIEGLGSNKTIQKLKIQLDEYEFKENTESLTKMLQTNSHLTHLDLGIDYHYDRPLDTFLRALRGIDTLTLKILDLSNGKVLCRSDSLASLKDLLSNKPNLTIFVSKNMFGNEDLKQICSRDFNMSGQLNIKECCL